MEIRRADDKQKTESKHGNPSSPKGKSDPDKKGERKLGVRRLLRKVRQVMGQKEQGEADKDKLNRYERFTMQQVAFPVLILLAMGMLLVVVIVLPVLLIIALIYHSPYAILVPPLESGDTVQTVTSSYLAEFHREVEQLMRAHEGHDMAKLVYTDYEESDFVPDNYADILGVYMVKYGSGDAATVINDTTRAQIATVVDDMCDYTTSSEIEMVPLEDGSIEAQKVLNINVTLRDYEDMVSVYRFDENQTALLEYLMDEMR